MQPLRLTKLKIPSRILDVIVMVSQKPLYHVPYEVNFGGGKGRNARSTEPLWSLSQ